MATEKVFFGSNIKFLREQQQLSQSFLAEKLDYKRTKYQALESGQTVNPPIEDLIKISKFFKVSIDYLLTADLATFSEPEIKKIQAGHKDYLSGSNLRVLSITVDADNRENMEYIPVKAKAGYQAGHSDPQYLAALPKFTLPNLPSNGTFRMFPTTGDSMLPIPRNSDIIAKYVQDWKSLKANTLCIVILKGNQDFVFKQVTIQKEGKILLRSLNKDFEPYTVDGADVLEIWKYIKHLTDEIPEPETDLQEIKRLISSLKTELNKP